MPGIELRRTFAHSDDNDGDVRMEFRFGRRGRLYRHWDEEDDYYDDNYVRNEVPGLIFDMIRTAMAEHRHSLREKEEKEDESK